MQEREEGEDEEEGREEKEKGIHWSSGRKEGKSRSVSDKNCLGLSQDR